MTLKKYEIPVVEFTYVEKSDVISTSPTDSPIIDGDGFFDDVLG